MTTLLMRNADVVYTAASNCGEIAGGGLFCRDGVIEQVAPSAELPAQADRVIDLGGHVLMPGMVNCHHHLYQNLTRVVPAAQNVDLFQWLQALYPIWGALSPEEFAVAAQVGMLELLLSGCTTVCDHQYLFPGSSLLDDTISAAAATGMRLHATRGSMSVGRSAGGLPPDALVESEPEILRDSQRLIERYHDAAAGSYLQIALAPCSPFSVSRELMRDSALLAREYGVGLHTHLAENQDDVRYSEERFAMTPGEYVSELGWTGPDVWHAHCVKLTAGEIDLFGRTGTGVAHCPGSNMRLGSGVAPIRRMLDAGVPVGLGVDGSASNDSGHLLAEARLAMLLQRVSGGVAACTARDALAMATRGGARVLGRDDIGQLRPGMQADCVAFAVDDVWHAGSAHDPVASLVMCHAACVSYAVVGGAVLVDGGELTRFNLAELLARHDVLTRNIIASL